MGISNAGRFLQKSSGDDTKESDDNDHEKVKKHLAGQKKGPLIIPLKEIKGERPEDLEANKKKRGKKSVLETFLRQQAAKKAAH